MKILLLEDNKAFADLIRYYYKSEEFIVLSSLEQGLAWLKIYRADLIFVDLGLDDSQGLDTLRALSHICIPKVVVTARHDLASDVVKLGAVDYVVKNASMYTDELMTRIGFNIEKYRPKPKMRFTPDVFKEIKACLTLKYEDKLTLAH